MDKATTVVLGRTTIAVTLAAMLAAPSLAFNAPKPLKHADFLKLNGSVSTTASTPNIGPDPGAPLLLVTDALNQGLVFSPRVAAARAQLQITKALYTGATEMPNPSYTFDNGFISEQTYRTGAQSTYQMPWKVAFKLLEAKRQVKESKLEILNTLWQLRNDIRRAYTDLVVAQETYRRLQSLANLAQEILTVSEKRFTLGDVPELDVLKARLVLSQTNIELEQGRRRLIRDKQQLNVMMGSKLDKPLNVPYLPTFKLRAEKSEMLPDFERPFPPLKDMLELAMANRLELKTINQQIKVAQAQLYSAVGNIIPDPVLNSGSSVTGNPPVGPKLRGFFMVMNFELPILNFNQGDIARLRATIKQYYLQYHGQENQIQSEVVNAYNTLLASRERIQAYLDRLLQDSDQVVVLARMSYQVGQSDITATLQAQRENVSVQRDYLEAVTAYQQAFTDLEQAVGQPLQ